MEQMEGIRDQQESLAKLHFDLGARQEVYTPLSVEGLRASAESMDLLMSNLERLSVSIGGLNPSAATPDGPNGTGNGKENNGDVTFNMFEGER